MYLISHYFIFGSGKQCKNSVEKGIFCANPQNLVTLFLYGAGDPDKVTLFQRIPIPQLTWSEMPVTTRTNIASLLECGALCSVLDHNSLVFDELTLTCSLSTVSVFTLS